MSVVVLLLPLALALLAESAWIAVIAGLLNAFALHEPVVGVPALAIAAAAGVVSARVLGPRLADRWSFAAVALAAVAGAFGWLASPEARELLRVDGTNALGPALAANPGGWLAALAFVRGMAHARLPVDPQRIGTLLAAGVPGLAVAALIGGMITEPWRTAFLTAAQGDVLLFLVAGIASLALARLGQVGGDVRLDAGRNPAWLVLLGGLVIAAAALAVWVGSVTGSTVATLAGALIVPLLVAGFVVGFDRRSLRILGISLIAAAAFGVAVGALNRGTVAPGAPPAAVPPVANGSQDATTGIALGVLAVVLIVAIVLVMVLARLWLRRSRGEPVDDDEVRVIDHGSERDARPRRRVGGFGRRRAPTDAVGAYLALLAALEGREPVARGQGETPAEHAHRLRAAGHGTLALDLLAADVGLARFAGADLGPAETRRAIARATRARPALLGVPVEQPGAETADGPATAPTGPFARGGRRAQGPGADVLAQDEPGTFDAILTRIRRGF